MSGIGGEPYGMGLQRNQSPTSSPSSGTGGAMSNMGLPFTNDATAVYRPVMPHSPSYQQPSPSYHQQHSPSYHQQHSPSYHQQQPNAADGSSVGTAASVHSVQAQPAMPALPSGDVHMNSVEPMKRKRGRPRKYQPDDGSMGLAGTPPLQQQPMEAGLHSSGGFSDAPEDPSSSSGKKTRGRPPGSTRKQQAPVLGSAGIGFTPHAITVKAGEDIYSKILSFTQNGARAVCVLSANGAVSSVRLCQSATAGGYVVYQGRYEILSLCGSYMQVEIDGQRTITGGLSVTLVGPDGRVLGGSVNGLIAASPVQVVVGSFIAEVQKESRSENQSELLSLPPPKFGAGAAAGNPPLRVTLSELSAGSGSSVNHQAIAACNNSNPPGMITMPWK